MGRLYLPGSFVPGLNPDAAMALLIGLYVVWLIFCPVMKIKSRNQ